MDTSTRILRYFLCVYVHTRIRNTENVSERRNKLIAEMFHKVHFVEKWDRGISLILSKEQGSSISI
ncbi:MAG: ATP-binding protein [Candidatus Woesearchaeota archaeon]